MSVHPFQMSDSSDGEFMVTKKIRVKLTGDGTRIRKRLHVVYFGFTFLDEEDKAYSAAGNHCLAIIKEPENYSSMKNALQDIVAEVNSLHTITVNGTCFTIEYFFGRRLEISSNGYRY